MSMKNDSQSLGVCFKCSKEVLKDSCHAMANLYHKKCFTCFVCHKELYGKQLSVKDGNPYCEKDFANSADKCFTCKKAIIERKILALGQPYHPNCFICSACQKSLDGQPFTTDDQNKIYCITDYYKKFAVKCDACKEQIVSIYGQTEAVRVLALNNSYHISCFKCEECKALLSDSNPCLSVDIHILCLNCSLKRAQKQS